MRTARSAVARLAFVALSLSACAVAPRKPFTPSPARIDAAAVYFYRPSEMSGRLISPTISADGKELGKLANDSYAVAYLPPGPTELRSLWPGIPGTRRDDSVSVSLEAGKSYYLRVRYHASKAHDVTPSAPLVGALSYENRQGLEQVDESEALTQLNGLSPTAKFGAP